MKRWLVTVFAGVLAFAGGARGDGASGMVTVHSSGGYDVVGQAVVGYPPFIVGSGDEGGIWLDGTVLFSTQGKSSWDWQPQSTGNHKLEFRLNGVAVTSKTVNVKSLAFAVQKAPNPPTAVVSNLAITPVTRNFGTGGGGGAIVTSGSGTWTASVSDSWITLNAATGAVGYPVAYTVGATAQVEGRQGYVYVSGHVHTVTQAGMGATISPESATFKSAGGTGKITVTPSDRVSWQARANVDWVNVWPVNGAGGGTVTFTVAPLREVLTRQGTLTVAGQTFSVIQYGREVVELASTSATLDYLAHEVPVTVKALSITEWQVKSNVGWISVVNAGSGKGNGTVTLSVAENPSWKARTGTVAIGTETFTVTQKGRTALEFGISPASTTAGVEGANGLIAVTATPDLPWSASSQANWLTISGTTGTGAGNGSVSYSAAANPTLDARTGKIAVTPGDTNVAAKTHTVTQPAAVATLSGTGCEFAAAGETCGVNVAAGEVVQWQIQNGNSWLTVSGASNRVGPGTVTMTAARNGTVYPRSGTVTIARKSFNVRQKGWGVELDCATKSFGTDGGYESLSIHPEGGASWRAVASDPTWITLLGGDSGTGDGVVMYIVSPYVGEGNRRTGCITVGDAEMRIVQVGTGIVQAFPDVHDAAGVTGAFAGAADPWLAKRIATVEDYETFREWIAEKALEPQAVKASKHAWESFALGAGVLFQNDPDIQIDSFSVGRDISKGDGSGETMDVSVTVKDGGSAVDVDAGKIAAMFSASSDLLDWDGLGRIATTATQTGGEGETMHFAVVPDEGAANGVFLRVALLTPTKAEQTVDFAPIAVQTWQDHARLVATASSGGAVAFAVVSGPGVVEGDVLTFTEPGTVVVRAVQVGNDEWFAAAALQTVTVGKAGQTISFAPIDAHTTADRVVLSATASSGGAVTFEVVSGSGVVKGDVLTFTDAGAVVVRAVQAGSKLWFAASATQTVSVKSWQTVSFESIGEQTVDGQVELSATATSGGAVTFEVVSGPGVLDGDVLTFTGLGTVVIRAVQAGDDQWVAASAMQTVPVKRAQTISFAAIDTQTIADRVELSATATSGGAVTFAVVSGPGKIEGNVLTFTGRGTVVVRAVQAGNEQWMAATAIQSVTVTGTLYIVVDLSRGSNASSYPVSYVNAAPNGGFNTDEYKTGKLVLRKTDEGYFGVFEVTQGQWVNVMGYNPESPGHWTTTLMGDKTYETNYCYGYTHPVWAPTTNVFSSKYSDYPYGGRDHCDSTSFIGKLRAKTGLEFRLPTLAQWRFACHAGTTGKYNNGGNTEADLAMLGRYFGNSPDIFDENGFKMACTAPVGSYLPNAWGFYDMHGNVDELCYGSDGGWNSCGGSCYCDASYCTVSSWVSWDISKWYDRQVGFRLSIYLRLVSPE